MRFPLYITIFFSLTAFKILFALLLFVLFFIYFCFLKDYIYLFMRDREREAETQAEGEAGSVRGAQCGTRSQDSRITPAEGRD